MRIDARAERKECLWLAGVLLAFGAAILLLWRP